MLPTEEFPEFEEVDGADFPLEALGELLVFEPLELVELLVFEPLELVELLVFELLELLELLVFEPLELDPPFDFPVAIINPRDH